MSSLGEMVEMKYEMLVKDEITEKLKPKIEELATKLKQIKNENRYVLLRFHGDADGISGALAFSEFLRFFACQQNAAVYSVKDAMRDLSNLTQEQNPVLIFIDFGMNSESLEGLKLLKAAGVELIVIDHHPPSEDAMKIADFYLTPWEFSGGKDVSHYVAGYLCVEVIRTCGIDVEKYAGIACVGDKSELLKADAQGGKSALVLDYVSMHTAYGNNLKFYKTVMNKKELLNSMYLQAMEKIEDARDNIMKSMKEKEVNGVKVVIIPLEKVVTKGEFPNRSKVTTAVFEKMNGGEPLFVIGEGKRTLILRVNDAAVSKGINAKEIAEKIRDSMKDFVESGGGHIKAGAIRVKEEFGNSVIGEIVRMIGEGENGNTKKSCTA